MQLTHLFGVIVFLTALRLYASFFTPKTTNYHSIARSLRALSVGPASLSMPVLFIPHGGGPLPLLGDPAHAELTDFLANASNLLPRKPSAILLLSAHWEETKPTLSLPTKKLLFDYGGFPPESYKYQYTPPPLGEKILDKILDSVPGISKEVDTTRGLDHGAFVPLMLMYPKADIPVGVLSLIRGLDPQKHLDLGRSLAPLLADDVLILGSGLTFHAMNAFFAPPSQQKKTNAMSHAFHKVLNESLNEPSKLADWASFPHARDCHPREEHLIPLLVCAGAAEAGQLKPKIVFDSDLLGHRTIGVNWV